jgi:hypothetical protein
MQNGNSQKSASNSVMITMVCNASADKIHYVNFPFPAEKEGGDHPSGKFLTNYSTILGGYYVLL